MKRPSSVLIQIVTAAVLILGGCSKSVEGESKRWASSSTQVDELAATYPGFRSAITARRADAAKIHDAAAGLEGDAKIEKLSEANTALMAGFVGDLDDIDDRMKRLREQRVEVVSKATDESSRLGAKVAAEDAQRALDRADAALRSGAADEAAAAAVLRKVKDDLGTAQSALDKVLAADRARQDKAAAASKAEAGKKADDDAAAKAEVAPWKCAYCSSENPHDEGSCKSCGAPRDGKAAKPASK